MMDSKITVSVIMSVYNGARYLREAIDSVLNQTFKDFEFIIVEDGSTDKTAEILTSYNDPRIKVITQPHSGMAPAKNKAIRASSGKYIAIMDADDISFPERFEKQVKFLETYKNIGLVGSAYLEISEDGRPLKVVTVLLPNEEIQKNLLICNAFGHGTMMFRKDCLDRIEFYREELKHVEDYDLALRFAEQYEVANIGEPLYKYRLTLRSISTIGGAAQNKFAELVRELGRERRQYGKDRLQTSSKEEIEKLINDIAAQGGKRDNLIWGYYSRGRHLYLLDDYKNALRFLIRPFPYNFFDKAMLVLILKAGIKLLIPERLWPVLKRVVKGVI